MKMASQLYRYYYDHKHEPLCVAPTVAVTLLVFGLHLHNNEIHKHNNNNNNNDINNDYNDRQQH